MSPIDPAQSASPNPRPPMAPPYVDEDPNQTLVEQGLQVAEDERRDAVTDVYEKAAREEEDPEESLNDIDYSLGDEIENGPEVAALKKTEELNQ